MIRRVPVALATAFALGLTATASAQERPVELSVAGGWLSPATGDFENSDAGLGGDLTVRFPVAQRVTVGGGAHWSRHGVDFADDSYDVIALFVEPRVTFGEDDASVRPFVSGRLAWVREAITVGTQDRSANGVGIGVLAGIVVPVSPAVDLELGAGGYHLAFGGFSADGADLDIDGGSGQALALRVALNVRP